MTLTLPTTLHPAIKTLGDASAPWRREGAQRPSRYAQPMRFDPTPERDVRARRAAGLAGNP